MERASGIEPPYRAWQARVLTIVLRPPTLAEYGELRRAGPLSNSLPTRAKKVNIYYQIKVFCKGKATSSGISNAFSRAVSP